MSFHAAAAPRRSSLLISKRVLSTTGASSPPRPAPDLLPVLESAKKVGFKYWALKAALAVGGAGVLYFVVDRPDVVQRIQAILQPDPAEEKKFNYFVVVGETGTGKSTAIRKAVSGLPSPRGVVMTPENPSVLASALAKAVNYDPNSIDLVGRLKRFLSDRTQEVPKSELDALLFELADFAVIYKAKHGRQPVLVIDAADFIAKEDEALMKRLQNFAKTQADVDGIRIVFACSEGSTLPLLMASSSIKRAEVIEIGDITDEQALTYLLRSKVPKERAVDAVANITGGRLIELNNYRNRYAHFTTNVEHRKQFDIHTNNALKDLDLKKDDAFFGTLLKSGSLPTDYARNFLSAAQLAELLKRNVIALHADDTFSFHSRVVETFFRNGPKHG